jgi:hypothetical protein
VWKKTPGYKQSALRLLQKFNEGGHVCSCLHLLVLRRYTIGRYRYGTAKMDGRESLGKQARNDVVLNPSHYYRYTT